ncbi:MAG TPA: diguanylate cyclase [Mycobacteriales bacterium]|jgi:two-component system chemotaxis response regulator CheY
MRILAVDDDAVSRVVVQAMVTSLGHDCILAANGREAWALLRETPVDVVISDRVMPDMDGLELCRLIREELTSGYTYVVLASGLHEPAQAREGMLAGADDYLSKPLDRDELQLRLIAAERVSALHRRLEAAGEELRVTARRDPLTGLSNRLQLSEDVAALGDNVARYGRRYSVALLDVDHFKAYNDLYGHPAGDKALRAVAAVLAANSRVGDRCYRYGGEEFLCVFPEQTAEQALAAVNRARTAVRGLAVPHRGSPEHGVLTVSAGLAEFAPGSADAAAALQRADEALYRAKAAGRDTVVSAG